jgi:hypothetical protein
MNAAGSISLDRLSGVNSTMFTKWKTPKDEEPELSLVQNDTLYELPPESEPSENLKNSGEKRS